MTFFCLISGVQGIAQGPKRSLVRVGLLFFLHILSFSILHGMFLLKLREIGIPIGMSNSLQFDIKNPQPKEKYEITLGMMLELLDSSCMGYDFEFFGVFFFQNIV